MINSAEEFVALRSSEIESEYLRAANEEAEQSTWLTVIDQYPDYREWVAQNKTVPIEILEILARDSSSQVRWMVAGKRKLPLSLQLVLANDTDESVRSRLVNNAKIQKQVLEILSQDPSPLVSECAIEKLKSFC